MSCFESWFSFGSVLAWYWSTSSKMLHNTTGVGVRGKFVGSHLVVLANSKLVLVDLGSGTIYSSVGAISNQRKFGRNFRSSGANSCHLTVDRSRRRRHEKGREKWLSRKRKEENEP